MYVGRSGEENMFRTAKKCVRRTPSGGSYVMRVIVLRVVVRVIFVLLLYIYIYVRLLMRFVRTLVVFSFVCVVRALRLFL